MARIGYFADLESGQTVSLIDRCDWDQGVRKMPRIYVDGAWHRVTRMVTLKSNPSRHECDPRCTGATGRTMQCECSCGGKNHGKLSGIAL
jgi:hypothetical protein